MPIYDMVFATDHEVGQKIMSYLYGKAAEREPQMLAEARHRAEEERLQRIGQARLFEMEPEVRPSDILKWEPTASWDPRQKHWWADYS